MASGDERGVKPASFFNDYSLATLRQTPRECASATQIEDHVEALLSMVWQPAAAYISSEDALAGRQNFIRIEVAFRAHERSPQRLIVFLPVVLGHWSWDDP